MKILFVLTSHDTIEPAGGKTGLWYEEIAAPYDLLKDAGAEVVMASPKGGRSPIDPLSQGENFQSRYNLTGLLDRAEWEATAWQRPWVAGRPDPVS